MNSRSLPTPCIGQSGIALIVVMVMLMLSSLAILSSTRLGWLSERMVGSESDQQRAFAAAEALIRDAENDIKGWRTGADQPCLGTAGCRDDGAGHPFFPRDQEEDLELLAARLPKGKPWCLRGICLPDTVQTLDMAYWRANRAAMTAGTGEHSVAARYGEFTGIDPEAAGNPLLRWSRPGTTPAVAPRAWYWVEVFPYDIAGDIALESRHGLTPDQSHPFVYRITVCVEGMRQGTQVWLRSVYVPRPHDAPELQ